MWLLKDRVVRSMFSPLDFDRCSLVTRTGFILLVEIGSIPATDIRDFASLIETRRSTLIWVVPFVVVLLVLESQFRLSSVFPIDDVLLKRVIFTDEFETIDPLGRLSSSLIDFVEEFPFVKGLSDIFVRSIVTVDAFDGLVEIVKTGDCGSSIGSGEMSEIFGRSPIFLWIWSSLFFFRKLKCWAFSERQRMLDSSLLFRPVFPWLSFIWSFPLPCLRRRCWLAAAL